MGLKSRFSPRDRRFQTVSGIVFAALFLPVFIWIYRSDLSGSAQSGVARVAVYAAAIVAVLLAGWIVGRDRHPRDAEQEDDQSLSALGLPTGRTPEAFAALLDLLELRSDPHRVRDAVVRRAVVRRLSRFDAVDAVPVLERILDDSSPELRSISIEGIGRLRHGPLAARIAALSAKAGPPERVAIAQALSRMGAVAEETTLLSLLRDDAMEVKLAAVHALGWIGTPAAVEPLLALSSRPAEVREEAEKAVGRIQARVRGAAGQISIAAVGDAGALSASEAESALSFAAEEPARDGSSRLRKPVAER